MEEIKESKNIDLVYSQLKKIANLYRGYFESELKKYVSGNTILSKAAKHLIVQKKAKRLRASFAIMACEVVGGKPKDAIPAAIGYELAHTATLIHDDIIDKSEMRRGVPTVHNIYGEDIAIIAGDLLIGKSLECLNMYRKDKKIDKDKFCELFKISLDYGMSCSYGQSLDIIMQKQKNYSSIKKYIEMIRLKTGSLMAGPFRGGALIGGGTKSEIESLTKYGENLGIAFQILDDLLDLFGTNDKKLKSLHSDIKNGKATPMLIKTYNSATKKEKENILDIIGKNHIKKYDINFIIKLFNKYSAINFTKRLLKIYSFEAKQSIKNIKRNNRTKTILIELADILLLIN